MELYAAFRQWAERPLDERFWTPDEMFKACKAYADNAHVLDLRLEDLHLRASGDELLIGTDPKRGGAHMTNWAFGQIASYAGAPAAYLRQIPPDLAARCLRHGWGGLSLDREQRLLIHDRPDDTRLLHAVTSMRYTRIWDWEIAERLAEFASQGWKVPPARPAHEGDPRARPATEADVSERKGGLSVNVGDLIAPAGLYASDHDMFAFMVNEDRRVDDDGDGLARGFFVSNSEVGAASFSLTSFLYDAVCGNHIVWGAKSVVETSIRHIGNADERAWAELQQKVVEYAESSISDEEAHVKRCIVTNLGADEAEVIDRVYKLGLLSKKNVERSFELAVEDGRFNPRSAWGMTVGITRASQELAPAFAEHRVAYDRTASAVLDLPFA